MTITATFSNGHTDTYKGKRAVKAAWAIIDRNTGEVLNSGHSLDRAKAQKTAEGNCRYQVDREHNNPFDRPGVTTPTHSAYMGKLARDFGYKNWKAGYTDRQNKMAQWIASNLIIEVVDL